MAELTGLNLICADVDATIGFYALLGIAYPEDLIWRTGSGAHHVTGVEVGAAAAFELDSAALGRAYGAGTATTLLSFGVPTREAVDEVHDRLVAAGHPSRQAPVDAFWGARFAIVDDPDGRAVGLLSPRDPDLNRPPPDL